MTQGDGMAEVTEADREKVRALLPSSMAISHPISHGICVREIAAALAQEREKARAPFLALLEEEEVEAQEHYAVTVEVPMAVGAETIDRIFMAVSDAAYEAQPEQRDWDVFVHGCGPAHQGMPLHFLRRAAEVTE